MAYRSSRDGSRKNWGRMIGTTAAVLLAAAGITVWILIQDAIVFTADGMRFEPGSLFEARTEQEPSDSVEVMLPRVTTAAAPQPELAEFAPAARESLDVEDETLPEGALPEHVVGRVLTPSMLSASNFASTARLLAATGEKLVVIDLKAPSGRLAYQSSASLASRSGANASATADFYLRDAVRALKEAGVTVYGRMSCIEDGCLADVDEKLRLTDASGAALRDAGGYALVHPGQKTVRAYLTSLATEAAAMGFDGLVLDGVYLPQTADASPEALTELVRSIRNVLGERALGVTLCGAEGLVQPDELSEYMDAAWGALDAPGVQYAIDGAGRLVQK